MIKLILNYFKNRKTKSIYPFVYKMSVNTRQNEFLKFKVNNSIESFRIVDWGGEKDNVLSLINNLKEDDILFDIGSSVGLISILSAHKLVKGKVYSFEPDPENVICLKKNFQLNKLKNFQILEFAIGQDIGELNLFTEGSNGFSPSLKKVNGINNSILVKVKTIDSLLKENKIEFPDVVKIDIEGSEMMALKGMRDLLNSANRPRLIYLEVHPLFLIEFDSNELDVFSYMSNFKYEIIEKIQRDEQLLCIYSRIE